MLIRSLASVLLLSSFCAVSAVNAEDTQQQPRRQRPEMRRRAMPGNKGGMQRNSDMIIARMVAKELKAYQESKTDENYKALEKATCDAVKKITEQRKKMMEKQLAELEKNQNKNADDFLNKVKAGDFKMPPMFRGPGRRGPRTAPEGKAAPAN